MIRSVSLCCFALFFTPFLLPFLACYCSHVSIHFTHTHLRTLALTLPRPHPDTRIKNCCCKPTDHLLFFDPSLTHTHIDIKTHEHTHIESLTHSYLISRALSDSVLPRLATHEYFSLSFDGQQIYHVRLSFSLAIASLPLLLSLFLVGWGFDTHTHTHTPPPPPPPTHPPPHPHP